MKLDLTLTSYIKSNKTLKVNTFDASSLNLIVTTETTVRQCLWNYQEAKEEEVDVPRTTTEGLSLTLEEVDYVIKMLNKARVHMVEQLENEEPKDDFSMEDIKELGNLHPEKRNLMKKIDESRFDEIKESAGKDEYRGGEDA